jgi:stage II sporulation protein M
MIDKTVKPYIFAMTSVFIAGGILGYLSAQVYPDQASQIIKQTSEAFGFLKNLNSFYIFLFIFINNSVKAFLSLAFGFFFGIVPILFIFGNGELVGVVISVVVKEAGLKEIAFGLVPHGIFEVPAVIIAAGYGLWLGHRFYRRLRHKEPLEGAFGLAIKAYFKIVLPLLLIAALVETFVTSAILQAVR